MFESIGPVWDGNEVWLVVAGGATFAAFPGWYASMFSGFYLALLLVLFFLIIRVVSFEWRGKSTSPRWRAVWLGANALGSFGASLIWGIGLANLLYGVPLDSNGDFTGTFWDLFHPVHGLRRPGSRPVLRVPRRGVPDAEHVGRSVRARAPDRPRGSRCPPPQRRAVFADLDGDRRGRPQRQERVPAGAAGGARDRRGRRSR